MATQKVTFTLDEPSMKHLREAAERLSLSRSEVVREAISEFHSRMGRLSEQERKAKLRILDELLPKLPRRSAVEVARETGAVRQARRNGGRLTKV